MQRELIMLLIGADLRQKSLTFDLKHLDFEPLVSQVDLVNAIFHYLDLTDSETSYILKEMYEAYVLEKLETLGFKSFRLRLHETAEELFMLLNTVKTLQENAL